MTAADLGLDIRRLEAQSGREGLYNFRLGYAEIPRYFAEGARTPFLGNGGNTLALPAGAGFPAADTASMPLATTLQPIELGYKAKRFDLSGSWIGQENFTYRVSLRRDVRDGTKPTAGSFFSTTSQLASPGGPHDRSVRGGGVLRHAAPAGDRWPTSSRSSATATTR